MKTTKIILLLIISFGIAEFDLLAHSSKVNIQSIETELLWSDPVTWGGLKPTSGQDVTIPIGVTILLDENTPELGGLTILGTLKFDDKDLIISAKWIMVHGELKIGTESQSFTNHAILNLTGSQMEENVMGMGTRGIMVMGGKLELFGNPPSIPWTKLNEHSESGSTQLIVKESVNWNIDDEIVVAPTDYYLAGDGNSVSQTTKIQSINGNSITTLNSLNAYRWGKLQYLTETGMSLTSGNPPSIPVPDTDTTYTPVVLDERAPVGNLTRNIIIQSPDDDLWKNQGFGVHIMIMGNLSSAKINGVEIKRGGQSGRIARYPFHWHVLSYNGTQTLPDASGQYIRNSVINISSTRGIVIHATNGVTVENNIVFSTKGHGIFLEDAVERRNQIKGNLVLKVRNPSEAKALKQHEINDFGSSGFWISNPDNIISGNTAADCQGNGFWLAFPSHPFGAGSNVLHTDGLLIAPNRLIFGVFDQNTSHSNRRDGIHLDDPEVDANGNTYPLAYRSTTDGREIVWPNSTLLRFKLTKYSVWKNGGSGIWDRATCPDNFESVSADNCGRFFAGSGKEGLIERCLVIGTSLNNLMNGSERPELTDITGGNQTPAAFATYHSTFDIKNNIVVNFPFVANTRSGAFATEDYYVRPVDKGQFRNINNLLINSHPGVRSFPIFNYYKLAGALWDPNNNWGGNGVNNYFTYDDPYFTYSQNPKQISPGNGVGGVLVNGPFYGINDFIVNKSNDSQQDLMAIQVKRINTNSDVVGVWNINKADDISWFLGHMRHFAVHPNGIYELFFPSIPSVNDVAFSIENMIEEKDSLFMSVEYDGSYSISQVYSSSWPQFMSPEHELWPTTYNYKHVFLPLSDKNSVFLSSKESYWQDKPNNKVWIKIKGGIKQIWKDSDYKITDDEPLYRKFNLRIYGTLTTSSLAAIQNNAPTQYNLDQNYPNPFNPNTLIRYELPVSSTVQLKIYDILGKEIETLVNEKKSKGIHTVQFSPKNLPNGTYFYRLITENYTKTQKMVLIK